MPTVSVAVSSPSTALPRSSVPSPTNVAYNATRRQTTVKVGSQPTTAEKKVSAESSSSSTSSSSSNGSNKQKLHEESIERMKTNLSRFARVSNKRMAIRTLQDCRYLRAIPMGSGPSAPADREQRKALEGEVCLSNIQLNQLAFVGSPNSRILTVLRALCEELCKGLRLSPESTYWSIISRLASTSNSEDSYFQLNSLLGSQDLVLNSNQEEKLNPGDLPPTDLSLYQANGQVHATVTSYHSYGLFRRSDLLTGKPWIAILAQIHERTNLSSGTSVRQVQAQITTPE